MSILWHSTPDPSPRAIIKNNAMQNILEEIVANKRIEVEQAKLLVSLDELKKAADSAPPVRSLRKSIESHHEGGIIAEFKRRSPSKDWINRHAKVEDIIPSYEKAGAAGLSILTDHNYFGGTLQDVVKARSLTHLPILRKEFVVDAYQLYEARAAGADACLLIAAAIGAERCHELAMVAHNIGLEVILEIHQAEELEAFSHNVDIVGVNNRNLKVFKTDPSQSVALYDMLPKGALPISESGLLDANIARRLHDTGYKGFLVGEAFMKTADPGLALNNYIKCLAQ